MCHTSKLRIWSQQSKFNGNRVFLRQSKNVQDTPAYLSSNPVQIHRESQSSNPNTQPFNSTLATMMDFFCIFSPEVVQQLSSSPSIRVHQTSDLVGHAESLINVVWMPVRGPRVSNTSANPNSQTTFSSSYLHSLARFIVCLGVPSVTSNTPRLITPAPGHKWKSATFRQAR